ncbi:MAG: hypothetical protein JST26_12920 [Bacteroidetes bacterium]|nr:hypothetical protein [Bacteroidota bacterium]
MKRDIFIYFVLAIFGVLTSCTQEASQKYISEFEHIKRIDSISFYIIEKPRFSGAGAASINTFLDRFAAEKHKNIPTFQTTIKDTLELLSIRRNMIGLMGKPCITDTIREIGAFCFMYSYGEKIKMAVSSGNMIITRAGVYNLPYGCYDIFMDYVPKPIRNTWRQ